MADQRRVWVAGGAAVAVILVFVVVWLITRDEGAVKDSRLVVVSVPNDLTLTLDGDEINPVGESAVAAGEHTLKASRQGFASETRSVRIGSQESLNVGFYLEANSPEGKEWYRQHPDQAREAEGARSREYDELNKRLLAKYPIISRLPVVGPRFRIDYGSSKQYPTDAEKIAIYIQASSPAGRDNALNWMRVNGFKAADFEIVYTTPTPGKWIYPSSR